MWPWSWISDKPACNSTIDESSVYLSILVGKWVGFVLEYILLLSWTKNFKKAVVVKWEVRWNIRDIQCQVGFQSSHCDYSFCLRQKTVILRRDCTLRYATFMTASFTCQQKYDLSGIDDIKYQWTDRELLINERKVPSIHPEGSGGVSSMVSWAADSGTYGVYGWRWQFHRPCPWVSLNLEIQHVWNNA